MLFLNGDTGEKESPKVVPKLRLIPKNDVVSVAPLNYYAPFTRKISKYLQFLVFIDIYNFCDGNPRHQPSPELILCVVLIWASNIQFSIIIVS